MTNIAHQGKLAGVLSRATNIVRRPHDAIDFTFDKPATRTSFLVNLSMACDLDNV